LNCAPQRSHMAIECLPDENMFAIFR
jgi:hypothetical protein